MVAVTIGDYHLEVATAFGPRITGLRRNGGPELLAVLGPDVAIEHGGGTFRFRGGHRLWASPENPELTYAPDDHQCFVDSDGESLRVTAGPDSAGMSKEIEVTADGDGLLIEHRLTPTRELSDPVAAWAITQFPVGGVALLPLVGSETGPLPNRQLTLWPYTSPDDERLHYLEAGIELSADTGGPMKVGAGPNRSPLGYLRDGQLFIKTHVSSTGSGVPDLGAGSQVYVGQGFCELETVGGLTDDASARVSERWTVRPCGDTATAWVILSEDLR